MGDALELTLADAPARSRFEARDAGRLAGFVEYRAAGGHLTILHTEVPPAYEGRGVATRLARFVLDDLRARGLRALIMCPFFRAYLARHPEEADLAILRGPASGEQR